MNIYVSLSVYCILLPCIYEDILLTTIYIYIYISITTIYIYIPLTIYYYLQSITTNHILHTYLLPSMNIFYHLLSTSAIPWDLQLEAEQNSMHGAAPYGPQAHLRVIRKKRMDAKHGWRKDIYHGHFVNYISYIDTYGICYVFFCIFFPINYSCNIRPWSGQDHWLTMHWPIVGSVRTCRECMSRHKERSRPITKSGSYVFSQIFS